MKHAGPFSDAFARGGREDTLFLEHRRLAACVTERSLVLSRNSSSQALAIAGSTADLGILSQANSR